MVFTAYVPIFPFTLFRYVQRFGTNNLGEFVWNIFAFTCVVDPELLLAI
jgi:hypothetical protein